MSENTLYKLNDDASTLVTEDFRAGDVQYSDARLKAFREATDLTANLDALEQVIDWVLDERSPVEKGTTEIEAAVAPAVRKFIDIPLREAGDPSLWHWLAIAWKPEFVRYRWPYDDSQRTVTSMNEKFLGSTQDLYTNAFSRMWFIAEFTCDGDDYSVTEAVFKQQYRVNRIFDRMDLRRPATGRALSKVAIDEDADDDILEETAKTVSHQWSVTAEECLKEDIIEDIVGEIHERVERRTM
ncbi:DUF6339 family protein [Haloarcula pellucida]|uniref:Uncharacterized protein n=1 Tax=Haloarcula pellucida TaxID=1427151 RepID=A0A830GMK8_9EURY|nr:DUF6339 family protein [Halomicroarcula pellucida]MBX0349022.1 hypothetical protein [Halomicroarcula pellucida]GGN98644.1 hypothetical protein GCM10009030_29270 [Halomicroarcula pellucida]